MSLYFFINEIQLSVTAKQMTPKLSGLTQQQIDFSPNYFAEQNSAGKLGPAPRGIHLP